MNTFERVAELAAERKLSLLALAQKCHVSYSTLMNAKTRRSQLSVDTIQQICNGLDIPLILFFDEKGVLKKLWHLID